MFRFVAYNGELIMEDFEYPIPRNLNECFDILDSFLEKSEEEERVWFKSADEKDAIVELHHTLGRWIRNAWGLWTKDTELYSILNGMGLWHPDDMSSVVLKSYHRKINGKELNLKEQVQHYTDFWKEYEKENGPVEKE